MERCICYNLWCFCPRVILYLSSSSSQTVTAFFFFSWSTTPGDSFPFLSLEHFPDIDLSCNLLRGYGGHPWGDNIPSRSPVSEPTKIWAIRQYSRIHWQFGALGVPWPLMQWTFRCHSSQYLKSAIPWCVKPLEQPLAGPHTHWKSARHLWIHRFMVAIRGSVASRWARVSIHRAREFPKATEDLEISLGCATL